MVAPLQYSGTMDSVLFGYWFYAMLLPCVCTGSVIVLDNARFHQKSVLQELAHIAGCQVLFLYPYSPDMNPIEHFRAWLKRRLRKILPLWTMPCLLVFKVFHYSRQRHTNEGQLSKICANILNDAFPSEYSMTHIAFLAAIF
jgi:transposase